MIAASVIVLCALFCDTGRHVAYYRFVCSLAVFGVAFHAGAYARDSIVGEWSAVAVMLGICTISPTALTDPIGKAVLPSTMRGELSQAQILLVRLWWLLGSVACGYVASVFLRIG